MDKKYNGSIVFFSPLLDERLNQGIRFPRKKFTESIGGDF